MFLTTLLSNNSLLQRARSITNNGIIIQEGFYSYLKINDAYIHDLFDLLETPTSKKLSKPDYFNSPHAPGAHITICYPEEKITFHQHDLGKNHTFTIENLYYVILENKKYFILSISAPSLNDLRLTYNAPKNPIYKGFSIKFHITIAKL